MNGGKIVVTGRPAELKAELGGDIITITSDNPACRTALENAGYKLLTPTQKEAMHWL
jgi:hypothetical protein